MRAVDGVSFHVVPGETLAIVGESGCGKSVTALSILRLVPIAARPDRLGDDQFRRAQPARPRRSARCATIRGNDISMIFQEPMTSLNPVLTIGRQIAETLTLHQGLDRKAALDRAVEMLRLVHIPEAQRRVGQYPHQLSGGMRQRVMIAMALACNPKLLIADEPTTALDVTIQAQILDLMRELKQKIDAAIVLITHDLGVVAEMAQRVVVMYAGRKVEEAPVARLVPPAAASLYARACSRRCRSSAPALAAGAPAAPRRDPRHGAVAEGGDPRLPVRAALRLRNRDLPPRDAGIRGEGSRALRRLLPIRPDRVGCRECIASTSPQARERRCSTVTRPAVKHFPVREGHVQRTVGQVHAVDGISFAIAEGETLGLVGESGCGKSTAGKTILKLVEPTAGEIRVNGERIDAAVAARDAALSPRTAGGVPGPVRVAQSAHRGPRHRRRAA